MLGRHFPELLDEFRRQLFHRSLEFRAHLVLLRGIRRRFLDAGVLTH
jgi:hypothetical protein